MLPNLNGSEKQIEWASKIRQKAIIEFEYEVQFLKNKKRNKSEGEFLINCEKTLQFIKNIESCRWWIDNRENSIKYTIGILANEIIDIEKEEKKDIKIVKEKKKNEKIERGIFKRTSGKYKGWFAIACGREDDFYIQARSLPSSRYSSPDVIIPPENFQEVIDFAEKYEFKISEEAGKIINEESEKNKNKNIINILKNKKKNIMIFKTIPEKIKIPEKNEVDDDLKD